MIDVMRDMLERMRSTLRRLLIGATIALVAFTVAFLALAVLASVNIHYDGPWHLTAIAIVLQAIAVVGIRIAYLHVCVARNKLRKVANVAREMDEAPDSIVREFEQFKARKPTEEPATNPVPDHPDH